MAAILTAFIRTAGPVEMSEPVAAMLDSIRNRASQEVLAGLLGSRGLSIFDLVSQKLYFEGDFDSLDWLLKTTAKQNGIAPIIYLSYQLMLSSAHQAFEGEGKNKLLSAYELIGSTVASCLDPGALQAFEEFLDAYHFQAAKFDSRKAMFEGQQRPKGFG